MARRMDSNRLDKDELSYELTVRGIALGTVDEMRSRLALARRMEKSNESLHYPEYPYPFKEDADAVDAKLADIETALDTFVGNEKSTQYLKLQTKLSHVLGRIDNMVGKGKEELKVRSELLALALSLYDSFLSKATNSQTDTHEAEVIPPNLSVLEGEVGAGYPLLSSSLAERTPQAHASSTPTSHFEIKPILPHKWNLKFAGDKKSLSVTAFFERVEEMRVARNVSKEILLNSGIDLFEGRAYEFYTDCRGIVSSWDELVRLFKEEYQPVYYSEKLLDEIKRRTQGQDETIGTYLAIMSRYFQRLQCSISEEAKLSILLRNIAPIYRNQLGAVDITSIVQLRSLCKRIELRLHSGEYVPPPRKAQSLEPDLAYIGLEESIDALNLQAAAPGTSADLACAPRLQPSIGRERQDVVCFKCGVAGHRAIGCASRTAEKRHCFKCNKVGFTVRNCPTCSGNGPRRV